MLRIFKVKRAVKNINPLEDSSNTYYEEVNMGGLMPNERALKVCYQNGDVWEARNLTTKSTQVDINKIFNSTLYEFNGFFIIKNKNDTASKEYYCFITVDKKNEVLEDKHWLIWLTVYHDLDGSTGFKLLLRWDLEKFIFTIVKNPIKINLLENDNFNKEENHYSLPTVAVIRKWYYHKEWLEINTPINNSQSMIYSIPVKCPMEEIELDMPKEDVIRNLIRNRTNKTDKEYDLLSMDFGRQAGYNGYNSMIISAGNPINTYDFMKQGNGYAWLSFLGGMGVNDFNAPRYIFYKITDINDKPISHPFAPKSKENFSGNNYFYINGLHKIKSNGKVGFKIRTLLSKTYFLYTNTDYQLMAYYYGNENSSYSKDLKNAVYYYIPFALGSTYYFDSMDNSKAVLIPDKIWKWEYFFQKVIDLKEDNTITSQTQIPEFADKPLEERYYMPLWNKLSFLIISQDFRVGNLIAEHTDYAEGSIYKEYYWGHNSHLQLKYLIGYWKARS